MQHRSTNAHVSLRAAIAAGLAGPLLALVVGAGAVVAAETSPYAHGGSFTPPTLSR